MTGSAFPRPIDPAIFPSLASKKRQRDWPHRVARIPALMPIQHASGARISGSLRIKIHGGKSTIRGGALRVAHAGGTPASGSAAERGRRDAVTSVCHRSARRGAPQSGLPSRRARVQIFVGVGVGVGVGARAGSVGWGLLAPRACGGFGSS